MTFISLISRCRGIWKYTVIDHWVWTMYWVLWYLVKDFAGSQHFIMVSWLHSSTLMEEVSPTNLEKHTPSLHSNYKITKDICAISMIALGPKFKITEGKKLSRERMRQMEGSHQSSSKNESPRKDTNLSIIQEAMGSSDLYLSLEMLHTV